MTAKEAKPNQWQIIAVSSVKGKIKQNTHGKPFDTDIAAYTMCKALNKVSKKKNYFVSPVYKH